MDELRATSRLYFVPQIKRLYLRWLVRFLSYTPCFWSWKSERNWWVIKDQSKYCVGSWRDNSLFHGSYRDIPHQHLYKWMSVMFYLCIFLSELCVVWVFLQWSLHLLTFCSLTELRWTKKGENSVWTWLLFYYEMVEAEHEPTKMFQTEYFCKKKGMIKTWRQFLTVQKQNSDTNSGSKQKKLEFLSFVAWFTNSDVSQREFEARCEHFTKIFQSRVKNSRNADSSDQNVKKVSPTA